MARVISYHRPARRSLRLPLRFPAMLLALGGVIVVAAFPGLRPGAEKLMRPATSVASGTMTAIDGDTFKVPVSSATPSCGRGHGDGLERVRVLPHDAPELEHARCQRERTMALRARERLQQLLRSGNIVLARQGCDSYGRTRAIVTVDGRNAADTMMREGLMVRFVPGQSREVAGPWCS